MSTLKVYGLRNNGFIRPAVGEGLVCISMHDRDITAVEEE